MLKFIEFVFLGRAVNSLPKHQSGYWENVAYIVGTRSAEECQEQYNAHQKPNRRPRKRAQKKPAPTEEQGIYIAKSAVAVFLFISG